MSSGTPSSQGRQPSSPSLPVRRRASQACQQCRIRKVKCVMLGKGMPCHNCQVDATECTVLLSRRSRKYRLERKRLTESLPASQEPSVAPTLSTESAAPLSPKPSDADLRQSHRHISPPPAPPTQTRGCETAFLSALQDPSTTRCNDSELPRYIQQPVRHHLDSEDLHYLKQRGAFSIPEHPLRDGLLLAFVSYVYPSLPVVDLQQVFDAIEQKPGAEISLVLFQALMFSGTFFVELKLLHDAGFGTRLEAQSYFFRKVKVCSILDLHVQAFG
jgi:hypothetical protein